VSFCGERPPGQALRSSRRCGRGLAPAASEQETSDAAVESASALAEVDVPTPIHAPTPIRNNTATPANKLILRMLIPLCIQLTIPRIDAREFDPQRGYVTGVTNPPAKIMKAQSVTSVTETMLLGSMLDVSTM
jgi:hypothetical protein